jgi:hypothetical protein
MEEFAELMEGLRYETAGQAQIPTDRLLEWAAEKAPVLIVSKNLFGR